jgi:glycosyltransferase involved in cell wall biosynthesis
MSKLPITAIVLTFNEERNLVACLDSIKDHVAEIVVVDSFSTDKTIEIAKRYTDRVYQHEFINQAKQFIWTTTTLDLTNEWLLRIDADERWTPEGFAELKNLIESGSYDGIYVKMRIFFMGRFMRHGAFYPNYFLRVYKKSKGAMEDRFMDEHIHVEGPTARSNIDVLEMNHDRMYSLTDFTKKHNGYSSREAAEYLVQKYDLLKLDSVGSMSGTTTTERKRWMKENFYYRLPKFLRAFIYWKYRYFLKLGFLDGMEGFIFHFLQGFWYRFLVDAKIYQVERYAREKGVGMKEAIKEVLGIEV